MRLLAENKLIKVKSKNSGNGLLCKAIDQLIIDIKSSTWKNKADVITQRPDADCVHSDGFFFFNIHVHRTLILIEFTINSAESEATIVWAGPHEEYNSTFKNNKNTITKWLRSRGYIK